MVLTLAAYNDRIASLFESSNQFIFLDSTNPELRDAKRVVLHDNSIYELLKILNSNNTSILICGAVSGSIRQLMASHHIQVIPWITGSLEAVITAFNRNELTTSSYLMPGCRRRGRHGCHGRRGRNNFK